MDDELPMYSDSRSRHGGGAGSGIAITLVLLLIIALGGGIGWVFVQMQQGQYDSDVRLLRIEQNQSLIKEALKITDENFSDIETDRKKRLNNIDDEIRKLWYISNVRNKKTIQSLEAELGVANNSIKTLTDVQTTDQEKALELANQMEQIGTTLSELQTNINKLVEVQQLMAEKLEQTATNKVLQSLDQRIASLESQRGNQNVRLVQIRENINLLRTRMLSLESSIQLPTKTIKTE